MPATESTKLGRFALAWDARHRGESGFLPLPEGLDGLGARLRALDQVQVSVDAQYFLLKPDAAGRLFLGKLLQAADRGVRVRLLIDDVFTPRNDRTLTTLASHPNIQIRLFNPLSRSSPVAWSIFWDFARTNRRAHNKSFVVDGALAIVGGRNIAAEYFELNPDGNFDDFEVLTVGPVVAQISASFDSFWNSDLSVPIEALGRKPEREKLGQWREAMVDVQHGSRRSEYERAANSELLQRIERGEVSPVPAPAHVVSDPPQKLEEARGNEEHLVVATALGELVSSATREVTLITPYFLLQERGRELIIEKAKSGVRIRVITNSLASTNHVPVHAHYRKYRKELLRAGIEIYEMRADRQPGWQEGNRERMTLHTKLFEIDGEKLVLGSVNLDPRSIEINTEDILVIDSPELSRRLWRTVAEDLPDYTWQVKLNEQGHLRWHYTGQGGPETVSGEPGASWWRRVQANFYRVLPIESQL